MTKFNGFNNKNEVDNKYFFYNGALMNFEMPFEINLEKIFENIVSIKTKSFYKVGTFLGIDVRLNGKMFSIIGSVFKVKVTSNFYELKLNIEYFPDELMFELEDIFDK
ncbi:hypothetical protein [Helicovermis profundi]|uniref:Uncharacterized protein n=1 Tax=Helicovermis profundi TaxID=3065157 RepID=A0AAU9E0R9_9FIRM|nr:hypothetical protein HLPR_02120 [Clostridia bacterium S502]